MAKKRSYTSTGPAPAGMPASDMPTEGIDFDIDGVTFTCHGWLSSYDLSELVSATGDGVIDTTDPDQMGSLSRFLRLLLGPGTYSAFMKHRRAHHTPDAVVSEILGDIMAEAQERATGRPTPRSSTSSPGPALTPVSSPATSSPEPPATTQTETEEVPEGLDVHGDIMTAPAGPAEPDPAPTRRIINLGDRTRTRSEPLTG